MFFLKTLQVSLLCIALAPFIYGANPRDQKDQLARSLDLYRQGLYQKSLKELDSISSRAKTKQNSAKYYLKGLIQNRLQVYDEAIISFEKSLNLKNDSKDLLYEYGLALYANSDLEKARKAFIRSSILDFKKNSSLYYVAHISQILEEHKVAKKYFLLILKSEKENKNLLQVSQYQLAESLMNLAEQRDNQRKIVKKYILPNMQKAIPFDEKSKLSNEIRARISELKKKYGLDPNIMKNGKTLSPKRWAVAFNHELSYDSNITQATDVPTARALEKDTFIHNTLFSTRYTHSFLNRFTVTPSLRITNSYHTDRESSTVFQNDTRVVTGSLANTYEYTLNGRQNSLLLNYDYTYTGRDTLGVKDISLFAQSQTLLLGNAFVHQNYSTTTIKFQQRDYQAYLPSLNNKTKVFSIDHFMITKGGSFLIFLFQSDFVDSYNATNNSTNNYYFRVDYILSEILPTYSLNASFGVSLLDTKAQKATRGTEKTYVPSIELRKRISKSIQAKLGADYTKNSSLDKANFDYSKVNVRFGFEASF